MFRPQLLSACINNLNHDIENAHYGGNNSQVEASHSYVDHRGLAVVIEIVKENEHFDGDNADIIDEPDHNLHLALVGAGHDQVKLKG